MERGQDVVEYWAFAKCLESRLVLFLKARLLATWENCYLMMWSSASVVDEEPVPLP